MAVARTGAAGGSTAATTTDVTVTVPAGTQVGDLMVVVALLSGTGATVATPSGWTLDEGPVDKGTVLRGYRFSKVAVLADLGATVTFTWSVSSTTRKHLEFESFSGAALGTGAEAPVSAVETVAGTTHTTPTVTISTTGAWIMEVVADRGSPGSTDLTAPAGIAEQDQQITTGGGGITSSVGDSNGAVATGTRGGDVWTGTLSTANAIMWTIPIVPTGPTTVAGTDTGTLTDTSSAAPAVAANETPALTDTAAVAASMTRTDTGTLAEFASAGLQLAGSDTLTLSEGPTSVVPFTPPPALGPGSLDDLIWGWFTARAPGRTATDAMWNYFTARSGLPLTRALVDHMVAYYAAALAIPNPEDVPLTDLEITFWQSVDPTNNTGSWAVRAQKFYGA